MGAKFAAHLYHVLGLEYVLINVSGSHSSTSLNSFVNQLWIEFDNLVLVIDHFEAFIHNLNYVTVGFAPVIKN